MSQNDTVNHPSHYADTEIECIDAIKAALGATEFIGYLRGNVMKYLWRYQLKGDPGQDLAKAKWYLERLQKEWKEMI